MNTALFEQVGKPYVLMTTGDLRSFDFSMSELRKDKNRCVAIMRGSRMRSWESFVNEIAAALQFPWYFGENWPALDECINDLSWLHADAYVLVVTNSEFVLSNENEDIRHAFGRLLVETCEEWSIPADEGQWFARSGKPFHVILHFNDIEAINNFGDIFDDEYKS
ncbi:MAG: barstar family protein [Solidesulfovibrio sp.]